MKSAFFEHHRPSGEEFKALWRSSVFSFDANVLLDIYRYSEASRDDLLRLISKYRDRIWIPYQAAYEFHKNRYEVIEDVRKRADDLEQRLTSLVNSISKDFRQHPYVTESICIKIVDHAKDGISALSSAGSGYPDLLLSDSIGSKLVEELEGRVGRPFSAEAMAELTKEIDERYANHVPPGYADAKDKPAKESHGDCILWFQLINFAKSEQKPIIFVTRDNKEDWWVRRSGRTLIPRPELRREFRDKTGQDIYFYQTPQFIQYAKELVDENISAGLVSESKVIASTVQRSTAPETSTDPADDSGGPERASPRRRFVPTKSLREEISALDERIDELRTLNPDLENDELSERIDLMRKRRAELAEIIRRRVFITTAMKKPASISGTTGNSGSEPETSG